MFLRTVHLILVGFACFIWLNGQRQFAYAQRSTVRRVLEEQERRHQQAQEQEARQRQQWKLREQKEQRKYAHVPTRKTSPSNKVEQELTTLVENECEAILENHASVLDRIWADEFTVISTAGNTVPRAQARSYLRAALPQEIVGLCHIDDLTVEAHRHQATVAGRVLIKQSRLGEKEIGIHFRFKHTLVKRQGRWQVTSLQFIPVAS